MSVSTPPPSPEPQKRWLSQGLWSDRLQPQLHLSLHLLGFPPSTDKFNLPSPFKYFVTDPTNSVLPSPASTPHHLISDSVFCSLQPGFSLHHSRDPAPGPNVTLQHLPMFVLLSLGPSRYWGIPLPMVL